MRSDKSSIKFKPVVIDDTNKPMPHDDKVESAILGAIMVEPETAAAKQVLSVMKAEHFYLVKNQYMCNAILSLHHKDTVIDIITVTAELRDTGRLNEVDGPYRVTTYTDGVSSSTSVSTWFHTALYPLFIRRKLIEISQRMMDKSYEGTIDFIDLLDDSIDELSLCRPENMYKKVHSAKSAGDEFLREMGLSDDSAAEEEVLSTVKKYLTGHKQFDDIVSICADKIMIAASHKAGLKSRFTNHLITTLAEKYPNEIACYWVSLEDSAKEQLRIYLSSKVFLRPESIKFRLFDKIFNPELSKWVKVWQSFDIKIRDQSMKIKDIGTAFKQFCAERTGKLCILIIDNVLSLDDRNDFKYDPNQMYDYIGNEILEIKRQTHALIIPVHHYNDDASNKSELSNGYRPRLVNLKGTEVWKRVAFQTLLINYPRYYKDLLSQYSGDQKEVLQNVWILDVATNRGHSERDEESLIRFFVEPDFCLFEEIDSTFEMPQVEAPSDVIYPNANFDNQPPF